MQKVPSKHIRVFVMDAHAGIREALATFIEASDDMELVGDAAGMAEGLRQCADGYPDVALVGITLRGSDGIRTIIAIRKRWPETRVIAMGSFQEEDHRQAAIDAGAVDYVLKNVSADELAESIRAAYASGPRNRAPNVHNRSVQTRREV